MLEAHGVYAGEILAEGRFEVLAFWADGTKLVMVIRQGVSWSHCRFGSAHELGHIVLKMRQVGRRAEKTSADAPGAEFLTT